jgi:hypothetical protein
MYARAYLLSGSVTGLPRKMRAKDPDVFDRAKRAHFDDGSRAVTTDDSELLWAYLSFKPSITSKMLAATSTPQSVLATSVFLPVRVWDSSW